ncbi:glutathione S-transferase, putative [Bodo saltans]|uniref:Glutathione S-transferase, putative n=1 Tax=Bodo saltans TaxID=75058 RepID=A0A0S4INK6_BODSA|nr:glutathione S-transferase, putative [Bodo saltans]|eukprot:CUE89748.1 glutathione S-transferase, putative [Bodo saltans]
MSFPELELIYFAAPGRARPIRLVLEIGKIPFKDTRVTKEEFGALLQAGELPLQTVPILKVDGKFASSQSGAIIRFVAALAGLQLTGATAVVRGEDIVATLEDILGLWVKYFSSSEEEKEKNGIDFVESGFPFYAKHIESILGNRQHEGPFVNEKLSWVDIYMYCFAELGVDTAKAVNKESPLLKFPRFAAVVKAVSEIPEVAAHQ